jgi:glycosyltransferase involved in cell wall biosynthesis
MVCLALSVLWRHASSDPVRALVLAGRIPALQPALRLAGPYGKAVLLWGSGDRTAAFGALESQPKRLAAFALAVDEPQQARAALERVAEKAKARRRLAARLAWREGRLAAAVRCLDWPRTRSERRLRAALTAELAVLDGDHPRAATAGRPRKATGIKDRVLHIVTDALPTTNAGYTVRTHQIAVAQRAAGLDPHVVTSCGFPVTKGSPDARRDLQLDGIPYHRLLPYAMKQHADTAADQGLAMAARLVERLRPAVLHAASNHANARVALALRETHGLPVVYEVRGFWEETWLSRHAADLSRSDFYLRSRNSETRCMREADLVVTLGEVMRAEIVARGVPEGNVIVVPNAVSAEFLQPLPDGGPLRAKLGIEAGEYVVGLVSSLVTYEGIDTLLQATAALRDRSVPVRPLLVGDGPERKALERQAAELGVPAIFTGRVPMAAVRNYHAILDIFVVPRTNDRVCQLVTPLKPVEAMASGLCVVTSEVKALTEIIKHEVTGALTIPQDPVSLAGTIEYLLYSPDIRRKLGENAREWVAGDRTWARNAERYREAYARVT